MSVLVCYRTGVACLDMGWACPEIALSDYCGRSLCKSRLQQGLCVSEASIVRTKRTGHETQLDLWCKGTWLKESWHQRYQIFVSGSTWPTIDKSWMCKELQKLATLVNRQLRHSLRGFAVV